MTFQVVHIQNVGYKVTFAEVFLYNVETFSIKIFMGKRKAQTANRKLQFAVTRLTFHVAGFSNFSKAFSSVQFSPFLFSQNKIIQYKNTYRNT